jgi:AP-4 complex subunit epsilon-1
MATWRLQAAGPKILKEKQEFDNLIKAIGECKSKAEEDRIITQELEVLKVRLADPKLDKSRGREYMVRLIYCEMLGHDASFAYIKALQFASDSSIHTKKAAYLALAQLLDHSNQLVLLLVNTMLSDLKSDNFLNGAPPPCCCCC